MVRVVVLSPQNEVALVEALAAEIRRAWPDLEADPSDRIDLLVGTRSGVDVDLLIALDLETPRPLRRARPPGAPSHVSVASGLIAVEIKQLDATRFERIGNEIFASYNGKRSLRSVSDQARDAAYGIKAFAVSSGFPNMYVHALAWLTQVDESQLAEVDAAIVGGGDWFALLAAACGQNASLCVNDPRTRAGVRAVRQRLLLRRTFTPLDRLKSERIARDLLVRTLVTELASLAGNATIRLAGHGGSGKTTALILLATRLATHYNARVLILTFHHAADRIHVETATSFLLSLVGAAGGSVPRKADSSTDYERVDGVFREVADVLGPYADGENGRGVIEEDRERFDWDHVLVDEAQDWTDAERDLLLAVYGSRRVVLADGLVQLIRRQTSCNWMVSVPRSERAVRVLGDSLRMQHNVALFANAVARTIGFSDWSVQPRADLFGGRVVVLEGELDDASGLVRALGAAASLGKADPVDNLICVPHSEVVRAEDGSRGARLALELLAAGETVWDACDPLARMSAPEGREAWRIVQYDSCRGLEGWATLLIALDDLYANRLKHPNIGSTDVAIDPEVVARRWLLIPLTRAVHLLVLHVRDPESPVARMVREAARGLPRGTVEFYAARAGAGRLHGGSAASASPE